MQWVRNSWFVYILHKRRKNMFIHQQLQKGPILTGTSADPPRGFTSDDSTGDLLPPRPAWQSHKIWEDWLVLFICFLTYSINISPRLHLNIEFNRRSHLKKNLNPNYLDVLGNTETGQRIFFPSSIHPFVPRFESC